MLSSAFEYTFIHIITVWLINACDPVWDWQGADVQESLKDKVNSKIDGTDSETNPLIATTST